MGWQRFTVEETQDPFRPGKDTFVVIDARTGAELFQCDDHEVCEKWRSKWAKKNSGLNKLVS